MIRRENFFLVRGLLIACSFFTSIDACVNPSTAECLPPLPNIRARFTQRGLDYGAKLIVDFITKNPNKVNMPEFPVKVGGTTITLSNMVIRRMPRPLLKLYLLPNTTSTVSLNGSGVASDGPAGQLQANITNLNPTIDATMKIVQSWRFFTTEREVNITATMKSMDLSVQASIEIDDDGRPIPSNLQCYATGDVSFVLKGEFQRWNWFVNSVYNAIKSQFRETVFQQVCLNLVNEINNFVDRELKNMSMSVEFESYYSFDYRLLADPLIAERFMDTSFKGLVTSLGESEYLGARIPVIPQYPRQVDRMVYVYITDSAVNSFWYAAMINRHLNYSITENTADLPETAKRFLSTTCPGSTCIGTIFPHISLNYPNAMATVDIRAVNTSYPPFRFQGRSIRVRCKGVADFFIETASSREKIFSVSLTVAGSLELNVSNQRAYFAVPVNSFRLDGDILSVPRSLIAVVPLIEPLWDSYLMLFSTYVFLPAVRAIGAQGIPLQVPTVPDLNFVDTFVVENTVPHVLVVGTDVEYTVPKLD